MNIFGKEIQIKSEYCSFNGTKQTKQDPHINLYVRITDKCQASCSFCEYNNNKSEREFDFYKFYYVLNELKKTIKINKVSFTGGEPTLEIENLNKCLSIVKELDKNIFTVVNSNGFNLSAINISNVNSISLSRHTWKNQKEIFKADVISDKALEEISIDMKKKIHISCNLIKGNVYNKENVETFINHYSNLGFHDFGFVSLMPVNEYCKTNFVDFKDIDFESIENLIKTKEFTYGENCRCNNFLMTSENGDINKIYCRFYCNHLSSESTLVFDVNELKTGFAGETII